MATLRTRLVWMGLAVSLAWPGACGRSDEGAGGDEPGAEERADSAEAEGSLGDGRGVKSGRQPGAGGTVSPHMTGAGTTVDAGTTTTSAAGTATPDDGQEGSDTDAPLAVDVGNPTDTGPPKPGEKGKVVIHLADAPVADGIVSLILSLAAIDLVEEGGAVVRVPLALGAFDLLDYHHGLKLKLFDGELPVGRYTEIRLVTDTLPVLLQTNGVTAVVSLTAAATALVAAVTFDVVAGEELDLTVHVDVRRGLTKVAGVYWLQSVADGFESASVGSLLGLQLPLGAVAVCAYPAGTPLAARDTTSLCPNAAGSDTPAGLLFRIDYLTPGAYELRVFVLGGLAFLDVPTPIGVLAGALTTIAL